MDFLYTGSLAGYRQSLDNGRFVYAFDEPAESRMQAQNQADSALKGASLFWMSN